MSRVYLSLGSNMGDSFFYLLSAISELNKLENTQVTKVSKFYKSKAWGYTNQEDFINCCVELQTELLPYKLLFEINTIETSLDRTRKIHWGPRTIDIDIIFYDDLTINDTKLTVPHKYYKDRNFVLIPLLDIIWNKNLVIPYIDRDTKGALEIYTYPLKIAISSCLLGHNVKYSGGNNYSKLFDSILKLDYINICPELLGGLKTPRASAERIGDSVVTKTGIDVSNEFYKGAELSLDICLKNSIKIAILQSRSPSCGYKKIYDGNFSNQLIEGNGITVDLFLKNSIKVIGS